MNSRGSVSGARPNHDRVALPPSSFSHQRKSIFGGLTLNTLKRPSTVAFGTPSPPATSPTSGPTALAPSHSASRAPSITHQVVGSEMLADHNLPAGFVVSQPTTSARGSQRSQRSSSSQHSQHRQPRSSFIEQAGASCGVPR